MKKILMALIISLVMLPEATAIADPVTRRSADLYVSDDGSTAYSTSGCTQTAVRMEAREVEHRGRTYLVFVDTSGEEEADCQVRVVVRRVERPDTSRIAIRTKQTSRRVARR
jgi:hypothetical protein